MLFNPGTLGWQPPNPGSPWSLLPKSFLCQREQTQPTNSEARVSLCCHQRPFHPHHTGRPFEFMDIFQTQKKIAKSSWMTLSLAQIFSGPGRKVFPESFYKGGSPRFFFSIQLVQPPTIRRVDVLTRIPSTVWLSAGFSWLTDNFPRKPTRLPQHHRPRRLKGTTSSTNTDMGPCKALISATLLTRLSEVAPGTWPTQPCIPALWFLSSGLKWPPGPGPLSPVFRLCGS